MQQRPGAAGPGGASLARAVCPRAAVGARAGACAGRDGRARRVAPHGHGDDRGVVRASMLGQHDQSPSTRASPACAAGSRHGGSTRPLPPEGGRRTPAPMPATGATRGPVRGVWGRGGGCGPRRRDRAPWASGGPDGGRGGRPETDAHRGIIGRSWPAQRPLSGPHPPPAAVDRRPIRRSARTSAILPHRSSRLPVAPAHSASLSRPPERMWTDGRRPAATAKEGPIP